jgi:N-acetylmuramoyl-L-alanine amidase/putative methionine-R-sulfoxide reductase with GAF domain
MATTPTKPPSDVTAQFAGVSVPSWPLGQNSSANFSSTAADGAPSHRDALQALLAFSALHEHVRRRRALAARFSGFDAIAQDVAFESGELFVLDDVLQLVAERAVAITGADGLAIALAENNEIVLRASAGTIKPDLGARIDRDSAFSGACFRMAQIVRCDDTESDDRVNLQACRRLGARSMVAVPLCGKRRVIGLLEAFSAEPFGFNDSDVRSLELLAELVLGALKPEDEDRFAQSAQVASSTLAPSNLSATTPNLPAPAPAYLKTAVKTAAPAEKAIPEKGPIRIEPRASQPARNVATAISIPAPIASTPSLPATEILGKPAVASVETVSVQKALAVEVIAEPGTIIEELGPAPHRSGWLILLACVVFAALFAVGLWWKLKTEQLGSAVVQPPKPVLQPVGDGVTVTSPAPTASTQGPAAASTENSTADSLATPDDADDRPATPQELSKFPRVTGIRHWSSATSTSVVLDLEDQVQYEAHRLSNPDRIYFDLHDTQLAAELQGKTFEVGDALLARIRVAQPMPGMTRVVLLTKGNSTFSVSLEPNPYRLLVQVRKAGAAPKGAVNLFPETNGGENKLSIVVPPPTKEDLQLRARVPKMRVVVDAGHGGWDLGTVGRRGLLEKDLVLEVAQRLGKLLETRLGTDVIYTRQDDNYIPLDERAQIANQSQADLFVSVHANYSDLPSARGVETYYTNFFSTPNAKDIETRENAAKNSGLTATLSPAELHEKIEQSRRLAASVQRSLYGTLSGQNPGLRDRGIKEAGFVVLTETAMPGILAEVSFVSSPTDEQKLRSDGYREQIAEALYRGIARYAATSRGVKVASAAK